jgi:CxxC-x17-CxxC domain-containing protein
MSDSDFSGSAPELTFDDVSIQCIDCRQPFVWTAGEQAFYSSKGLTNPPKRCKPCKKEKNKRLDAIEHARATGQRYRVDIKAECARCQSVTTIPFYPSQGRPVYCRACYLEVAAQHAASGANAG